MTAKRGPDGVPESVARAFPALDGGFELISGGEGLLHRTLHLRTRDGRGLVLQRVSDVFAPGIHDNILRVSTHLRARGVPSLVLESTREGAAFLDLGDEGRWRLMARIEGVSFHRAQSSAQIESASEMVGRFHRALDDFEEPLEPMGIPFRDTALYRARLASAIADHADEGEWQAVDALRESLDAAFEQLGPPIESPARVIHGDLKISNVLFESEVPPGRDHGSP